ncbi:hypothetical protein J2Y63_006447 [Shinella sp. BE166]
MAALRQRKDNAAPRARGEPPESLLRRKLSKIAVASS